MRTENDRPDIWPFILASFLGHILLIALLAHEVVPPALQDQIVEVFQIEEPYQIADIAKPKVELRPKKAKFLGMYDSQVKRETVASGLRSRKRGRGRATREGRARSKERSDKLLTFDRSIFDRKRPAWETEGGGSSVPEDFYPHFRRGPHTYLNVLRYPDVEYFVRLKRAFKITFSPESALRSYFAVNRVTRGSVDVVLGVSVDRTGELAELFLFRSSGIAAYDQEAMRTVRASSPFSTPPKKFLDDDGLLRMSWTFTVYL